ncbi:MAG: PQQ-binding-like beta-propeller repeat protein [Sphingosinicella sp.]|nr:PQQ-binding-like beta-propeller repeat protein [Sphingosinicella sp.]
MKRMILALSVLSLLGGCGIFKGKDKPTTPTIGQRIAVLAAETSIEVDPALAEIAVTLPEITTNDAWAQPGGNAAKSMGHLALGSALGSAWSADAGVGSSPRARLAAAPVVAGNRLYVVDTTATLRAFDATTGAKIWESPVGDPKDLRGGKSFWTGEWTGNAGLLYGGGVSFDNGRLYATNGLGDTVAFDANTGAQLWRVRPGGPLRGAPTIANDNVYVVSQDNQMFALNPADGSLRWTGIGTLELAGVFGSATPAAAQGTIVAGFSSGELNAYRYENGRILWQDALARTSISTAVGSLSDIDANPVIDQGRVYAIGQGGRMVAMELTTGQRIWEINAAGISTPWVAGEWIFVVTDQAQLFAIARATGKVRWMTQLPRYENEKKKSGPISWVGPVLAGNRLILGNSKGHLVNVSPFDGAVQSTVNTKNPISLPPLVANGTLYILSNTGRLTAWR